MSWSVYWAGYADAWRAEWIKARTVARTCWFLVGTIVLGIGLSVAVCAVVHYQVGGGQDPAELALSGIQLAQALIAIWAVRAVSSEYRSGIIHTTLIAVPQRVRVLIAKASVSTALALATGTVITVSSLLIARSVLMANGFTAAHGLPLALTAGPTLRAAFGSVLYLGLISLLATSTALVIRDSAAATGTVLGLLYLFPLATQLAGNATWQRHLQQIGPSTAGLDIQATTNLSTLPIQPWAGISVLAAWATASLIAGGLAMHLRDS